MHRTIRVLPDRPGGHPRRHGSARAAKLGPVSLQRLSDERSNHLGRRPVMAGGLVGVDLLRDALVRVPEPVGDHLAVDPRSNW